MTPNPLTRLSKRDQYHLVLLAGVLLRITIFFGSSLPSILQRRPELSTPITSLRSLKEGVYIFERGSNPYDGGVLYHSPLYLAFFTYIIPISSYILTSLLWTLADILSAQSLARIWQTRKSRFGEKLEKQDKETLIAALFLFNPYTIVTCLARSTTTLDNALVLLAISTASTDSSVTSLFFLALAFHTSLYPILLLPPLIMLLNSRKSSSSSLAVIKHISIFVGTALSLTGVNWSIAGWSWLPRTWGVILTVSDLTPNVGMWWYFFTEMFDHFRIFFLGVFQLHIVIYVAPICIRLRKDPQFAILVLLGVMGTWKSYPTLGDTALWAGMLACFPEVVSNLRHPLFTLTVSLYTSILLPLLHSLWLLTGTGNANFFYAATMVHGLNLGLAVADVLIAGIKAEVQRDVGLGDVPLEAEEGDHTGAKEIEPPRFDGLSQRWDRELIQRVWRLRHWEAVQFSGVDN